MPERSDGPLRPSGPPLGSDREIPYREPRGWLRRHLRSIVVVVVVLLVVGGIVTAVLAVRNVGDVTEAQATAVVSAPVPSSTAPASPSPSPSPSPTVATSTPPTTATGTVTAVVAVGQWTVAVQPGLDISVVVTAATTYAKGKSAEDVKQGSTISVVGTMANGVVTATSVTIEKKAAT